MLYIVLSRIFMLKNFENYEFLNGQNFSKIADVVLEIDLNNMNVLSARIEGKVNPLDEDNVIRIIEIWDVDSEFEVNPPF